MEPVLLYTAQVSGDTAIFERLEIEMLGTLDTYKTLARFFLRRPAISTTEVPAKEDLTAGNIFGQMLKINKYCRKLLL